MQQTDRCIWKRDCGKWETYCIYFVFAKFQENLSHSIKHTLLGVNPSEFTGIKLLPKLVENCVDNS